MTRSHCGPAQVPRANEREGSKELEVDWAPSEDVLEEVATLRDSAVVAAFPKSGV
jgi:hypothetical protein